MLAFVVVVVGTYDDCTREILIYIGMFISVLFTH